LAGFSIVPGALAAVVALEHMDQTSGQGIHDGADQAHVRQAISAGRLMLDLNGVLIGLPVHATLSNARQACVYPVNYRPQTGILALAGFAIRRMRSRPRTPPPIASSLAR
jgi:hypothetical protein